MPQEEIGRHLGITRNAVYKLGHDARKKLKHGLEASGFDAAEIRASVSSELWIQRSPIRSYVSCCRKTSYHCVNQFTQVRLEVLGIEMDLLRPRHVFQDRCLRPLGHLSAQVN